MKAEPTFPQWMKEERERRGLTQRDLAEMADIHFSTLANTETGRREPTAEVIVKVCSAFDLTPKEAISWLARAGMWKRPIDLGDAKDEWWLADLKRVARGASRTAIQMGVTMFAAGVKAETKHESK